MSTRDPMFELARTEHVFEGLVALSLGLGATCGLAGSASAGSAVLGVLFALLGLAVFLGLVASNLIRTRWVIQAAARRPRVEEVTERLRDERLLREAIEEVDHADHIRASVARRVA